MGWYDRKLRQVRDLSCGDTRIFLALGVRRLDCRNCGKVKRERLDFLETIRSTPSASPILSGDATGKGNTYRIVVSALMRGRTIWFGGDERSEALRPARRQEERRIRLAVMDTWKPFRFATQAHAPQAAILFDKFHVMRQSRRGSGYGAQERVRAALGPRPALHQGSEIHLGGFRARDLAAWHAPAPTSGSPPSCSDHARRAASRETRV
jgi:transposase